MACEFRYREFIKMNIDLNITYEEQMKNGIKLFHYLGGFKKKAFQAAKEIIDDLIVPSNERKFN